MIIILSIWIFLLHFIGGLLIFVDLKDYHPNAMAKLQKMPALLRLTILCAWPYIFVWEMTTSK
ncbi:hypothetical protein TDB9533_01260 [Thalassocella blandensis]|nr:hypothetical protein TDB9533_01260 [Thalassocella blandensis]